jgi:hypothetical protein
MDSYLIWEINRFRSCENSNFWGAFGFDFLVVKLVMKWRLIWNWFVYTLRGSNFRVFSIGLIVKLVRMLRFIWNCYMKFIDFYLIEKFVGYIMWE